MRRNPGKATRFHHVLADLERFISGGRTKRFSLSEDSRELFELIESTADLLDVAPYEEVYLYALLKGYPAFRAAIDDNGGNSLAAQRIFSQRMRLDPWESYDQAAPFALPGSARNQLLAAILAAAGDRGSISITPMDMTFGVLAMYDEACPPISNGDLFDERMRVPVNTLSHIACRYYPSLNVSFDQIRVYLSRDSGRLTRRQRVFICYAANDAGPVRRLARRLERSGFDVWIDISSLTGGDDWQLTITNAIRDSDSVVVCVSSASIAKRGFVQREISLVLEAAGLVPEGIPFVIPVRLDPCQPPVRLQKWHSIDLFERGGFQHLYAALRRVPAAAVSARARTLSAR